jgi:hypothetical protein
MRIFSDDVSMFKMAERQAQLPRTGVQALEKDVNGKTERS